MAGKAPSLHGKLNKVSWLLGKWRTNDGKGIYPTIKNFKYGEEIEFTHVGQPNLQFSFYSWHAETMKLLHREVGFLHVKDDSNEVSMVIAANNGITDAAEGKVNDQELLVESHTIGRLTFGKDPATKKIRRHFKRDGDKLEVVVDMQTANTELTNHLRATYQKV